MTPRFLVCDTAGKTGPPASTDGEWVRSPLECLYKALESSPGIVIVRFPETPVWRREALIVLCAALKQNSETKETPLLALLPTKHRRLTEELHQAGVDFIKCLGDAHLDAVLILETIASLSDEDRVDHHFEVVCPFLHYTPMDPQQEMTVCGAYLDRMVLGGCRLRELCKTEGHLGCEYFLNPRRKE